MPVIIEDTFTGIAQDLYHPRIGWHQEPGTIAATNAADGFAASNALSPVTYTAWKPSSAGGSLRITFASAASPSYLGIAVHTAATEGATITVQKRTGSTWSNWGGGTLITPETNDPILFLLEPQTVSGIGIRVTGGTPVIGVMRAGSVMEWPRRATWTGLPITESERLQYDVNASDTGNWLGRSVRGRGNSFDVEIDHLSEAYRSGDFRDFADHCNKGDATFWIAPRPLDYADEVAYAWSPDVIRMSREQPNKLISGSVSMSLQGYLAP